MVKRKTSSKRFRRALSRVTEWCRVHRHDPVRYQHQALSQKIRGHYSYYGITGNGRMLTFFVRAVERAWQKWLSRRSQHALVTWDRFQRLLAARPLPPPRVVHSVYAS